MSRLPAAVLLACSLFALAATAADGASATGEIAQRVSSMYIAPMAGTMFYRLYDPAVGMVEFCRVGRSGRFAGPNGWKADLNGETMTVTPPNDQGRLRFRFKNGSPVGFLLGDDEFSVQRRSRPAYLGPVPEMWDVSGEESPFAHKWKRRLAWPYQNPNCAAVFYSILALAGFLMLGFKSGRRWKAAGAVVFCGFIVLVLATGSRGGLIALAFGMALMGIARFVKGRWTRGRVAVAGLLAALFVVAFAVTSSVGRKSWTLMNAGNALRTEVWGAAPRMMVDAPGGWAAVIPSGRAYVNWYQPLEKKDVTVTLISGHLTFLSDHSWFGRFVWIFLWIGLLVVLFRYARRGGSPLPLGVWSMFALADCFNPVHTVGSVWLLPVASLYLWLRTRPWNGWRGECVPLLVVAGVSVAILAGIHIAGSSASGRSGTSVRVDGARVLVNGDRPTRWVVDDGETLCWTLTGKDIRSFYAHVPQAPALGLVRRVDDVPKSVDVLVVAGSRCRDYLGLLKNGQAPRARKLVFLSPQFGPADVPPGLVARGGFLMVLGEFASRYVDVYGKPPFPDWVATVDGAELYIPGWVGLVTSL